MLALGEVCFEGIWGVEKRGLRCCHCVKYVLRAWGELERGLQVLALDEMCFEGMGVAKRCV